MNVKRTIFVLLFAPFFMTITETIILACFSSPVPPTCARTIYLAKTSPGVVLIPAGGGAFTAPVGVVPFVSWDTQPACAQYTAPTSLPSNPLKVIRFGGSRPGQTILKILKKASCLPIWEQENALFV